MVEQVTVNHLVGGSSPSWGAIFYILQFICKNKTPSEAFKVSGGFFFGFFLAAVLPFFWPLDRSMEKISSLNPPSSPVRRPRRPQVWETSIKVVPKKRRVKKEPSNFNSIKSEL